MIGLSDVSKFFGIMESSKLNDEMYISPPTRVTFLTPS